MRRFFIPCLVVLFAIVLVITGCSSSTPTTTSPISTTPQATTPTATSPATTTSIPTTAPGTTTTAPATTTKPVQTTTPAPGSPIYGGTLNWLQDSTITNINPPADGGTLLLRTLLPCLEPLLRYDENGNLQGYLAQSWQVADDGKSITFKLRQGIKFQDGTPFNADAVKYNLEATYKSGVIGSAVLSVVKGYDVIDDSTLRMNLSGFDYRLMSSLATAVGLIASPTALKKPATPDNIAQLHMVGTGPFVFNSWKRDDFVKYTRNPNYWVSGQPYLDAVNIMYIADRTVSVMAFRSGVANRIEGVDPVNADLLEKLGFKVYVLGLRFQHAMMFDSKNPNSPFANVKVREALNYAIDKQTLIQGIGGGAARGYTALNEMAEPNNPWYVPNLPIRGFDLAKAKQLLTDAGYPNGFKTKLTTNVLVEQDWIQAIQNALAKVNIIVTVDVADVPRFTNLTLTGWDGLVHPGFPTFSTIGGLYARWGDPAQFVSMYKPDGWTDKWAQVLSVTDETKRMSLMKDLVTLDYQQSLGFSYRANAPLGVDAGDVHNFQLHVGGSMDVWWPERIWIDKK